MKIAILGSTGQIGSRLTKAVRLAFPNDEILACSRKIKDGYFSFDPFTDDWQMLGKLDILINALGAIEPTPFFSLRKVHIGLAEKMLENYTLMAKPRLLQISVLGADPNHQTEFLKTKGAADDLLIKLPGAIILRPSIVYTPNTMIVRKINIILHISRYMFHTVILPANLANTKIQPIMAEDLNDVIIKLIGNKNYAGIIELAGPEKYTVKQLIEFVAKRDNRHIKFRMINDRLGDILVGGIVARFFPKLISREQYILLKEELPIKNKHAEKILGRALESVGDAILGSPNDNNS